MFVIVANLIFIEHKEVSPHGLERCEESLFFRHKKKEKQKRLRKNLHNPLKLHRQPISRVLYPLRGVCHSSIHYVTIVLKRSTLQLERAALKRRFTRTCSSRDARPVHRCTAGGLLPHLLTLTLAGGYFLLRYSAFANSFLLGSGMLCAARTFLFCLAATATDWPSVIYGCKVTKKT